ncbi:MOSC domain-containing protein [Sphingomonas naphthae]|uniref:MOSC domain-containing protein n=1 Tax=Sphingomonas naphthae TaxID=1813468 RepID=A0ABY7TQA9_9SPHN|nr:MOSC domain-containing protein [Sphingomonas naphthae]WCT74817.1 MOSC domain-containing protein [Sphingomonas naphthae]
MVEGRLIGIARHDRPRGEMETLDHAEVTTALGVVGDFRGAAKPGSKRKRQVTVMAAADWLAAVRELGVPLEWQVRRVNLLVEGLALPRVTGTLLRFAGGVVLEVTGECDPCSRMDTIAPGLKAVLTPDWRGGITTRVIADGPIALGDRVEIEWHDQLQDA